VRFGQGQSINVRGGGQAKKKKREAEKPFHEKKRSVNFLIRGIQFF
jgi:hypothetical protein